MKKITILLFFVLFLSSLTFAYKPSLTLSNQTIINSEETALVFSDYSGQIAVNNKVKLKADTYLSDKEKDKQYDLSYKVNKKSRALKIDRVDERFSNKFDLKLSNIEGSSVDFKLVDEKSISNISITRYEGLPTEVIRVENITLDYATVTLAKTYETYISSILHSDDGINFEVSDINFSQNKTHIWFNTTHFSSFTGSIPNFDLIIGGAQKNFDVDDYASIDSGHYVRVAYPDGGSTSNLNNKGFTGSDFTCEIATNDFDDDSFQVCLNADNEILLDALSGYDVIDDSITTCIYDSSDSLEDCDTFNVEVRNFELPYAPASVSTTSITTSSATVRGQVYFGDFTGTVEGQILYREFGSSTWITESYNTISDGNIFTRSLTGLDSDTVYQYLPKFRYTYDSVTYIETGDVTGQFSTSADTPPSVTTLSVSGLGSTTATLRGLPDKGDYTGTVTGHFWYKKTSSSTWIEVEKGTITDDTQFTETLNGLTTGDSYHYFASLEWNDGTPHTIDGSIITFTPVSVSSSNLETDLELYYSLDNADLSASSPLDLTDNNNDPSNNGMTTGSTGIINEGFDVDGTDDYLKLTSFSWFPAFSLSYWLKPDTITGTSILFRRDTGSYQDWVYASTNYEIVVDFGREISNRFSCSTANNVLTQGVYQNVIIVYDNSETDPDDRIIIYVDGSANACSTSSNQGDPSLTSSDDMDFLGSSTLSASYQGKVDEISAWSRVLTSGEALAIYNSGSGISYPFPPEASNPIVTTLSSTSINQTNATLRGIADFKDFTGTVYGSFEYKLNTSSTWDYDTPTQTLTNDTIFTYTIDNLSSNTQYDFRSIITYYDGESLNGYGDLLSFNTSKIDSVISNFEIYEYGEDYTTLFFNLTLNDMPFIEYIVEYSLNTEPPSWSNEAVVNITEDGGYYYNISTISDEEYITYIVYQDENGDKYTGAIIFIANSGDAPQINNEEYYNILRESATLNFNVTSMGEYTQFLAKLYIGETGTNVSYSLADSLIIRDLGGYSFNLTNLTQNTTYASYIEIDYISDFYKKYLDNFKTKSSTDFIDPIIETGLYTVDRLDFTVSIDVILNDAENIFYKYFFDGGFMFETLYFNVSEDGNHVLSFNTSNYGQDIIVSTAYTYFNGTENIVSLLSDYTIEIQSEDELPIVGGTFTIFGDKEIYISNPYLFALMLIVGLTLVSISITFVARNDSINKLTMYIVLGLLIFALIWLRLALIIPSWQIIITLIGVVVIGLYLILSSSRGGYYG